MPSDPSEHPEAAEAGGDLALRFFRGRLHPWTLLFAVWESARGLLVPLVVVMIVGRRFTFGNILALFVFFSFLMAVLRYVTFRYSIQGGELITRSGWLHRRQRHIPLTRVQDIRIEQGLLHRWLQVAEVHVETASGEGEEATLAVLEMAEAERLQAAVYAIKGQGQPGAARAASGAVEPPAPEVIWRVPLADLVLAGLTSNHLASGLAIVALIMGFADDVLPQRLQAQLVRVFVENAEHWVGAGGGGSWLLFAGGFAVALGVGAIVSVVGVSLLFYEFTLVRSGDDLQRAYGFLTRRTSSLPRRRIQVLMVEAKPLRRLFGLATLRVDTAAAPSGTSDEARKSGRDVLVPVLPAAEVEALLPRLLPDFDARSGRWQQVSRVAIRRGVMRGVILSVALSGAGHLAGWTWLAWSPVALIPLAYVGSLLDFRHLGYWLGRGYVRTRRGWLTRAGHVLPFRNIQVVALRRTPLDRRHGVATLRIDTAGQAHTGGGPRLSNLPWNEAVALARTLVVQASRSRYR